VRIASLNINGFTAEKKVAMLAEFLYRNEITLMLLQEVTQTDVARIRGYDAHLNIGADMRGTAILVRNTESLEHVLRLPSGRGITASYKDLLVVNVYAPAGTSKRAEREHFYTAEIPGIRRHTPGTLMIGGDFNCTQQPNESTRAPNPSGGMAELLRRLALTDSWDSTGG
jgi:exonuclease III